MNSKIQSIELIEDTMKVIVQQSSKIPAVAVGCIMLNLANVAQLIKGEPLPPAEQPPKVKLFNDRLFALGEEAEAYIVASLPISTEHQLLTLYNIPDDAEAMVSELPRVNLYDIDNEIEGRGTVIRIWATGDGIQLECCVYDDNTPHETTARVCRHISQVDAEGLCQIADQLQRLEALLNPTEEIPGDLFPNGFDNWSETHFKMCEYIFQTQDIEGGLVQRTVEKEGTGGLFDLANKLTTGFETLNKDNDWVEEEFTERIDRYIEAYTKAENLGLDGTAPEHHIDA